MIGDNINKYFILFILCVVFINIIKGFENENAYNKADLDHNGLIDRTEFMAWSKSLYDNVIPYLLLNDKNSLNIMNSPKEKLENKNDKINNQPMDNENMNNKNMNNENYNNEIKQNQKSIHSLLTLTKNNGFWDGFISGVMTIWATEIGDKTFFIAAILSMKNDRIIVFAGAIMALIVMTVLSVALGGVASYFLPKKFTHYAGACLFVFFGFKMLYDARGMSSNGPSEELTEVEEELQRKRSTTDSVSIEEGKGEKSSRLPLKQRIINVFSQSFFLTFLAEWGDRSQIATITLSAAKDPIGVSLGSILGHSMCTGLAVVGGKLLAAKISEKTVTIIGGILFLVFAMHSFIFGP